MSDYNELSERELEILRLVATGASNKEIAQKLYISPNTVKVHLKNIFAKVGAASRTEAAMAAIQLGLVPSIPEPVAQANGNTVLANADLAASAQPSRPLSQSLGGWFGAGAALLVILFLIFMLVQRRTLIQASVTPPTSTPGARWEMKASLPQARAGLAVVTYENQIYAFAGETEQSITGTVSVYDPEADAWKGLTSKPIPATDICAATIGGKIYVPGGRTASGEQTNVLEIYDPITDDWSTGEPLPVGVSGYALASYEGRLYLFGGWDGTEFLASVYEYDPQEEQWSKKTSLPIPVGFAGAAVSEGKIFILGGYDGKNALQSNLVYYPDRDDGSGDPWEEAAPLPEGRYAMGVANIAEIIHVVGGKGASRWVAMSYQPVSNEWQQIDAPIQLSWSRLGLAAWGTKIYGIGGALVDKPSAQNAAYQAIFTMSLPIIR